MTDYPAPDSDDRYPVHGALVRIPGPDIAANTDIVNGSVFPRPPHEWGVYIGLTLEDDGRYYVAEIGGYMST
jgi:hypothetical protein